MAIRRAHRKGRNRQQQKRRLNGRGRNSGDHAITLYHN
jgi:hypothetical protein